jgi:hypothetical protein
MNQRRRVIWSYTEPTRTQQMVPSQQDTNLAQTFYETFTCQQKQQLPLLHLHSLHHSPDYLLVVLAFHTPEATAVVVDYQHPHHRSEAPPSWAIASLEIEVPHPWLLLGRTSSWLACWDLLGVGEVGFGGVVDGFGIVVVGIVVVGIVVVGIVVVVVVVVVLAVDERCLRC